MRKPILFLAVVAAVLAVAAPAFAHEEINPKQFPTGTPTFFTLSSANDKTVDLNKITIAAPANVKFGDATRSPAGWTVDHSDTSITWTGGPLKPNQFEQWGYEIEGADQPGTLTYKVTLGYANGTSDDVQVQTTAVAPGGGGASTTVAAPGGTATTTVTTEAAKSNAGSTARTRANIALVVGAVALVLGIIALVVASRKRTATATTTATTTGGGEKQDW